MKKKLILPTVLRCLLVTVILASCGKEEPTIPINKKPVANAGTDQTIKPSAMVTLDGSGSSDADGNTLTYQWSVNSSNPAAVTLSDATVASPTFTASSTEGEYKFSLVVNDGTVNSEADEVKITVTAVNSTTVISLPRGTLLTGVAYGNNTFVAVGYTGRGGINDVGGIYHSSDGLTWTEASYAGNGWIDVIYVADENRFIAVGGNGRLGTLMNGSSTWSFGTTSDASSMPVANHLTGVVYNSTSNRLVYSSNQGIVGYSALDGTNFVSVSSQGTGREYYAITYGNNQYVAVGKDGVVRASADGVTWSDEKSIDAIDFRRWTSVTYGASGFIAATSVGGGSTRQGISTDGTSWILTNTTLRLRAISYANSNYVLMMDDKVLLTTGITGTTYNMPTEYSASGEWERATYGQGKYVVVGRAGKIATITP